MTDTLPSYNELQTALSAAGCVVRASECHGVVVGQFCAAPRLDPLRWFQYIFDKMSMDDPAVLRCAAMLGQLAQATDRQLKDEGVAINLLLPDDGTSLAERTGALAEWCQGFLLGISMAQIGDLRSLPPDSYEFVQDVSLVARYEIDTSKEVDEDEHALTEVIEYLRIGALMLREEVLFRPREQ